MPLNSIRDVSKYFLVALLIAIPAFLLAQDKVPIPTLSGKGQGASLLAADAPHSGNGIDCLSCHVAYKNENVHKKHVAKQGHGAITVIHQPTKGLWVWYRRSPSLLKLVHSATKTSHLVSSCPSISTKSIVRRSSVTPATT